MNEEVLVSVDHISRYYGGNRAVDDISFSVRQNEVVGLLGVNGSGKSTIMQMISGVLPVSTGRIIISGHDMFEFPKDAKKNIGFLPEQPPLYKDLYVDEYLCYAGRLRGLNKKQLTQAVAYSKQKCGLNDVNQSLIKNLSKGFQQRVGIAQAIIHSPKVLILDEPSSGLDLNQIIEIRKLISELGTAHSVILSTHILPEVQSVCNRVLIINQGKLVLDKYVDKLNDSTHNTVIKIALKQPPSEITPLTKIRGVIDVEKIDDEHFKIHCESGIETINRITEQAVTSQWQLYEITSAQDFEELFVQLTSGRDPV